MLENSIRELTEAELDAVTGGLAVVATDLIDINNNDVQVAVPVTAAVGILGAAGAAGFTGQQINDGGRPGRR
jgi:hypothetical protein